MQAERTEEYLETILYLIKKNSAPAKTKQIADELNVSSPSVTEMVQKLSNEGLDDTIREALKETAGDRRIKVHYDGHIRYSLDHLDEMFPDIDRGVNIRALQNDREFVNACCSKEDAKRLLEVSSSITKEIERAHEMSISDTIARDIYGEAGHIVDSVVSKSARKKTLKDRIDNILTSQYMGSRLLLSHFC